MGKHGKTLAEQVADRIFEDIQMHRYAAGQRLPTEKELCTQMNAGRNTVREALKILASRNVVTIRQGAGTYLSEKRGVSDDPFGFSMITNPQKLTRDLLQVRIMLEPPIAALAAQCATGEDIAELGGILGEMEAAMQQRRNFSQLDVEYHIAIAKCTHNLVMENLIPVISKGVMLYAETVSETEYVQTLLSHRAIYECIRLHQSFEAEQEMRFHILFNRNRY